MTTAFSSVMSVSSDRERVKSYYNSINNNQNNSRKAVPLHVIFPWGVAYKTWWGFTVFAAGFTIFFETYEVAFSSGGLAKSGSLIVEIILLTIFILDIIINFNLAYYDENNKIIFNRQCIFKHYIRKMFWVDLIGVIPFYLICLQATGTLGEESQFTQNLGLLQLLKLVRIYRVAYFFSILQYNRKISLISLTLIRNFSAALVWTHVWACIMFFIARESAFGQDTWLGSEEVADMSSFENYVTALYWSVVTFTTVGYGDFSPANPIEQIFGMIYMLLNVVLMAWIIGSITLLIVRSDEKTSLYRETLHVLHKYSTLHNFDKKLTKRLRNQLKLDFDNKDIGDEQVLQFFPASVRRKILRKLYLPSLLRTRLLIGTRQQFVDAFLSRCKVEIFSPGEEILTRGSATSDLYLLLEGKVETSTSTDDNEKLQDASTTDRDMSVAPTSVADSTEGLSTGHRANQINGGDNFLNDLGFFTESPQPDTSTTRNVCKVLSLSKSDYQDIANQHPGSAATVLNNLLHKVEELPQSFRVGHKSSRIGVSFEDSEVGDATAEVQARQAIVAIRELVQMHINKQKDDHTTRFVFAASRGCVDSVVSMIEQGFDPDSSDYDKRTGLMLASAEGHLDVVTKLLEYHANPNLTDMHGVSALHEATRNNHEDVASILLRNGGELSMSESLAASTLCQAVFDGDITLLKRLLNSGIQVNASDYDKRTASHIAASEGNTAALKLLVEAGADLSLEDRWGNTVESEAKKAKSGQILEYFHSL